MFLGASPSLTSPFPHQTSGKAKLSLSVTSAASDAVKWFAPACQTAPCARFTLSSQPAAGASCWKSSEGFLSWYKALAVSFDREAQSVGSSDVTARGHSGADFTLATAGASSIHMHS